MNRISGLQFARSEPDNRIDHYWEDIDCSLGEFEQELQRFSRFCIGVLVALVLGFILGWCLGRMG